MPKQWVFIQYVTRPNKGQNEKYYQTEWAKEFNGMIEVKCASGRVDIMTDTYVYEVKAIHNWKSAVGQILAYSKELNRYPSICLYGEIPQKKTLKTIRNLANVFKITVHMKAWHKDPPVIKIPVPKEKQVRIWISKANHEMLSVIRDFNGYRSFDFLVCHILKPEYNRIIGTTITHIPKELDTDDLETIKDYAVQNDLTEADINYIRSRV